MKKVFYMLVAGVFLTLQFILEAKSLDSNIWIIIDGPGVGIQVLSDTVGGTNIPSGENMAIQASGSINPPDSNCIGNHYNGSFYGQGDPAPVGCGWGQVVSYGQASQELQAATDLLHEEESARLELKTDDPDFEDIKDDLKLASRYLDKLLKLLDSRVKAGTISHKNYNKLKRSLNSVSALDNAVHLSSSGPKEKDIKKLSTAYDIKVRIIKQIIYLEPLLKPNP